MCGICGFSSKDKDGLLLKMSEALLHRGPDDKGFYSDENVSLGFRRLSIIDLKSGNQPLSNEDRRIWVVCNGEIYNYLSLKEALIKKGHKFYTNSDIEVLPHLYEEYGDDFLKEVNGEFALALWDSALKRLLLARDRLGIRPLYYYRGANGIYFASEIKPLFRIPGFSKGLNFSAVGNFLALRYIPGTDTLLKGVYRLGSSEIAVSDQRGLSIRQYWGLDNIAVRSVVDPDEAAEEFLRILDDSVKLRLMSEVPLGAFISGGIDSAGCLALMTRHSKSRIKTFCIGFGTDIDESSKAERIAGYFGSEHRRVMVNKDDYKLLPDIVGGFDDPVGDAIIIPAYILSRESAKELKVVLTGEGADELSLGYVHQRVMCFGQWYYRNVPQPVQKSVLRLLKYVPLSSLQRLFNYPASLGNKGRNKLAAYLSDLRSGASSYLDLAGVFNLREQRELLAPELNGEASASFSSLLKRFDSVLGDVKEPEFTSRLGRLDTTFWLPDYLLLKQDRLAMAHSLEARVPYLDHRLVEYCAGLPQSLKIRGRVLKYIIRRSFRGILPEDVLRARKQPFYIPTEKCFGKDFLRFITEILSRDNIKKRGLFNWESVERLLCQYDESELIDNKKIIALAILELWLQRVFDA